MSAERPYERHAPIMDARWIERFVRAEYWRMRRASVHPREPKS